MTDTSESESAPASYARYTYDASTSIAALSSLGWIPCDGSGLAISSSTYAALYAVIGSMYGADGSNFYLPDYRGRFLRGIDGGRGIDPDSASRTPPNPSKSVRGNQYDNVGSLQADNVASHTHTYVAQPDSHTIQADSWGGPHSVKQTKANPATGDSGDGDTRPKNISVYYLIKYANPSS